MPIVKSVPSYIKDSNHALEIFRDFIFPAKTNLFDDSDFSNKSEKMCHFFKNRGYPDSVVNTAQHRAQQIDRHEYEYMK